MERIAQLREKSRLRQELIARELGAASCDELTELLGTQANVLSGAVTSGHPPDGDTRTNGKGSVDKRRPYSGDGSNLREMGEGTEDLVYGGSAAFLKGTQSENPHNDYSQHYVDTGNYPANFIRDPSIEHRFTEYPKLKELIRLKDALVSSTATPPMYLKCNLESLQARQLCSQFDVIIIEPPLEEYFAHGAHQSTSQSWSWDQIESLDIPSLAATRAFVWLWCGASPDGTMRARRCLSKWGFRRCEDICWVKTNSQRMRGPSVEPNSVLHRAKEHCLMGIKGTVRRSVDGDFIHANVDMDLIIDEERPPGDHSKPVEIFLIAEHFCLGRRRLHLFGNDHTLRPGWVTVGPALTSSNFDAKLYRSYFEKRPGRTTGCTERIEALRPKSPERGGLKQTGGLAAAKIVAPVKTSAANGAFVRSRRGHGANTVNPGFGVAAGLQRGAAARGGGTFAQHPTQRRHFGRPAANAGRIVRKHKRWAIAVQRLQKNRFPLPNRPGKLYQPRSAAALSKSVTFHDCIAEENPSATCSSDGSGDQLNLSLNLGQGSGQAANGAQLRVWDCQQVARIFSSPLDTYLAPQSPPTTDPTRAPSPCPFAVPGIDADLAPLDGIGIVPAGSAALKMVKIMHVTVAGVKRVGKTAFLQQLALLRDITSEPYDATVDDTYSVQMDSTDRAPREVMTFHDTAGIEPTEPATLKRPYLLAADAFLLVYSVDDMESFRKVDELKKFIDRSTLKDKKEIPIVVVGTKCDLDGARAVDKDFAVAWALREKVKLYEVSATDRRTLLEPTMSLSKTFFHPTKESKFSLSRKIKSEKSGAALLLDI